MYAKDLSCLSQDQQWVIPHPPTEAVYSCAGVEAPVQTAMGCCLFCVRTITNKKNRRSPRNPMQCLDLMSFSNWTFDKKTINQDCCMPDVSTGTSDTCWIKNPLRKFGWFCMKILTWGPVLLSYAACEIKCCLWVEKKDMLPSRLSFLWLSCVSHGFCCCAGSSIQYLSAFIFLFSASWLGTTRGLYSFFCSFPVAFSNSLILKKCLLVSFLLCLALAGQRKQTVSLALKKSLRVFLYKSFSP